MLAAALVTGFCVLALLVSEAKEFRPGVWIAKPLASLGFLAAALAVGALQSTIGCWIFGGLVLCLAGDVLLLPSGTGAPFKLGIGSFLLGHLAFAVAFLLYGVSASAAAVCAIVLAPALFAVWRWMSPSLPTDLRIPVICYVVVIAGMVVSAIGALGEGITPLAPIGAVAFAVSDVAVARDRFVTPSPVNARWGLPLYYGAQLLLAASAAPALMPA